MNAISNIADLKQKLRVAVIKKRDSIPEPVRRIKGSAIEERLFAMEGFVKAGVVLLFASFRSEPETHKIIDKALSLGKKVLLPKVEGDGLSISEIKNIDDLKPGYMGIPEPVVPEGRDASEADFILVPGAAFDVRGYRIGYGKGYYDRLLKEASKEIRPLCVSIAFEEQMIAEVPTEPHDERVDVIITDRRVIDCHE